MLLHRWVFSPQRIRLGIHKPKEILVDPIEGGAVYKVEVTLGVHKTPAQLYLLQKWYFINLWFVAEAPIMKTGKPSSRYMKIYRLIA